MFTTVTRWMAAVGVTIVGVRWSYRSWRRLRSGESDLTDLKLESPNCAEEEPKAIEKGGV
jgi:hypothetical protein